MWPRILNIAVFPWCLVFWCLVFAPDCWSDENRTVSSFDWKTAKAARITIKIPEDGLQIVVLPAKPLQQRDWELRKAETLVEAAKVTSEAYREELLSVGGALAPGQVELSWVLLRGLETMWPEPGKPFESNTWGERKGVAGALRYDVTLRGQCAANGHISGTASGYFHLDNNMASLQNATFTMQPWKPNSDGTSNNPGNTTAKNPLIKPQQNEARYRWQSDSPVKLPGPQGITVKEVIQNGRRTQALSGNLTFVGERIYVDLPGARDVKIEIDPQAKSTGYAGLTFTSPCVLEITSDGTLLCDREIEATDAAGTLWKSQPTSLNGRTVRVFFSATPQSNAPVIGSVIGKDALAGLPPDYERLSSLMQKRLPAYKRPLVEGDNTVRIYNPNDFWVMIGLRTGDRGLNFHVLGNGATMETNVADGDYQIFFVYSTRPDALFRGDDFKLRNNGVEIKIVKVVGGNYNIRQVE